jgi:hypothetical protein
MRTMKRLIQDSWSSPTARCAGELWAEQDSLERASLPWSPGQAIAPSVANEWSARLFRIPAVTGSNLGSNIDCLGAYRSFSQSLQENTGIVT